jgi:hypothetical protein
VVGSAGEVCAVSVADASVLEVESLLAVELERPETTHQIPPEMTSTAATTPTMTNR